MKQGKALIFSAPSGAGKTTIVRHLVKKFPSLDFSVSATTREKRANEQNGKDYYFLDEKDFKDKLTNEEFLEWEEVYDNVFYGTMKSEVERIWREDKHVIFDVDVEGGLNLKSALGDQALSVFIKVNEIDTLRRRLESRMSESPESLNRRVEKAESEMKFESQFDEVIINDKIQVALEKAEQITSSFLDK